MTKAVWRLLLLTLLSLTNVSWGFYAHRKVNRYAVFALPPEMIGFYKRHIEYLTEHAVDPDKRRYVSEHEAVKHYIDLDHYGYGVEEVFDSIPQKWYPAIEKFTEDTLKTYGVLPWNILWVFNQLVEAFEQKDCAAILSISADLGHYIGDAHVPLHTTENYNGQLSGQKGIHGLWESRIPELEAEDYQLVCGRAEYLNDPLSMAWQIVKESHLKVEEVLRLEKESSECLGHDKKYSIVKRGAGHQLNYSENFTLHYSKAMQGMVEERMHKSIHRIASFWFTAWVNAGQPDLNGLVLGERKLENDSLDHYFLKGIIKGREH